MRDVKWYEVLADRLRSPNGGGGDRPHPFVIITIWAGFVLVENRAGSVVRMGRDDRCRSNRGTALRNRNDCCLRSKSRSRLGAHTSLDRVRKGCICLLAGIVMIGDRVSMVIRGV